MANLQVWGQAPRRAAGTQRLWRAQGRQEGPQGWEGPQGQEAPHHLPPSPPLSPEHAGGLAAAQGLPPAQGELSPSAQAGCEVPRRCQQHTRAPSRPRRAGSTRSRRGSGFACGGRGRNFANPITSLPSSLTEHGIDFPHWVYLGCLFCEKANLGRLTVAPGLMRKPCQRRQRFPRLAPCRPVIGHSAQCRLRICPAHSLHTACTACTAFTQPLHSLHSSARSGSSRRLLRGCAWSAWQRLPGARRGTRWGIWLGSSPSKQFKAAALEACIDSGRSFCSQNHLPLHVVANLADKERLHTAGWALRGVVSRA